MLNKFLDHCCKWELYGPQAEPCACKTTVEISSVVEVSFLMIKTVSSPFVSFSAATTNEQCQ